MPTDVSIEVAPSDGCLVMTIVGEVDMDNSHLLRAALADLAPDLPLVLDLSKVPFIDSVGLSTLTKARRDISARGRAFVVVPSAPLAQLIEITGLDHVLVTRSSLPDALAAADGHGTAVRDSTDAP